MGILDSLTGSDNQPHGSVHSILATLLSGGGGAETQTQPGLAGLVQRFEQAGLGGIINSWIGNGQNQEVEPDMLERVLGSDQVDQWSQETGAPKPDLLSQLSQFLPNAIDRMTPSGELHTGGPETPSAPATPATPVPDAGAKMGGPERR